MSERTLDPDALDRLHRIGGNAFVVEMIELFLENAPLRLASARGAMDSRDQGTLHRAVHSLKSTAATLGAYALRNAAGKVEARAKAGALEEVPALLDHLEREITEAREQLLAERDRLARV